MSHDNALKWVFYPDIETMTDDFGLAPAAAVDAILPEAQAYLNEVFGKVHKSQNTSTLDFEKGTRRGRRRLRVENRSTICRMAGPFQCELDNA